MEVGNPVTIHAISHGLKLPRLVLTAPPFTNPLCCRSRLTIFSMGWSVRKCKLTHSWYVIVCGHGWWISQRAYLDWEWNQHIKHYVEWLNAEGSNHKMKELGDQWPFVDEAMKIYSRCPCWISVFDVFYWCVVCRTGNQETNKPQASINPWTSNGTGKAPEPHIWEHVSISDENHDGMGLHGMHWRRSSN